MLASNGPLARTYLRFGLTLLGVYVILYGLPEWMEVALHLSPGQSGLLLIPMGAIATVISRPIASRNLVRGPLIISAACLFLGGLATLFLTGSSPLVAVLGVTALFGITTGTTSVSTQTALYVQTPAETVGTASGLLRTSGYLGSVASATITGAAFRSRVSDTGLHTLATVLLGIGIVVLLLTVFDRTVTSPKHDQPPDAGTRQDDSPTCTRPSTGSNAINPADSVGAVANRDPGVAGLGCGAEGQPDPV